MSNRNNLSNQEAIQKIKDMTGKPSFVMMCTDLGNQPFHSIPMTIQEVDDDGACWFFSGKGSTHNQNISRDARTQLLLSEPGDSDFFNLYGDATIVQDRDKAEKLWNSFASAWFEDGIDDENFTLVKFTPSTGQYWDNKSNKMVAFLKMAAAAITGQEKEIGVSGKLAF